MRRPILLGFAVLALGTGVPAAGQILTQNLLIDDLGSGFWVQPEVYSGGSVDGWRIDLLPPVGYKMRSLAGAAEHSVWYATAQYGATGDYHLVAIPQSSEPSYGEVRSASVGWPNVEALTFHDGRLLGAGYTAAERTVILEINPSSGAGTLVGSPAQVGLAIRGLAAPGDGKLYGIGLAPSGGTSTLYEIDVTTGAATALVALPQACESLGSFDSMLLAGGVTSGSVIDLVTLEVTMFSWETTPSRPNDVVALSGATAFTPVGSHSWTGLKDRFRPSPR